MKKVVFVYLDFDRNRELALRLKRGPVIPEMIMFQKNGENWNMSTAVNTAAAAAGTINETTSRTSKRDWPRTSQTHDRTISAQAPPLTIWLPQGVSGACR